MGDKPVMQPDVIRLSPGSSRQDDNRSMTSCGAATVPATVSPSRRHKRPASNVKLVDLPGATQPSSKTSLLASNQLESPSGRPSIASRLVVVLTPFLISGSGADSLPRSLLVLTQEVLPPAVTIPDRVPLQFLQRPHVLLTKWSALVTDMEMRRVAAHNVRIASTAQRTIQRRLSFGGIASRGDTQGSESTPLGTTAAEMLFKDRAIPFVSDDGQRQPADSTKRTRSIVVNGADQLSDAGLLAIVDAVPTLEVLEIAGAICVTDAALRALAHHCAKLRRLNISECTGIRGAGLSALAESRDACEHMRELELAGCSNLGGDWALQRCVYAFTKLERLNVAQCALVTDALLQTLASQCGASLRGLLLSDCVNVTDAGVVAVAHKCHQLEEIALNRVTKSEKITDTACAALGEHCKKLQRIDLAGCRFLTDGALQWLATGCGASLQHVSLRDNAMLTDASARFLGANCPQLLSVALDNVSNVSDVGLRMIAAGCPNLRALSVRGLYLVSDGAARNFGIEGLRAVAAHCTRSVLSLVDRARSSL